MKLKFFPLLGLFVLVLSGCKTNNVSTNSSINNSSSHNSTIISSSNESSNIKLVDFNKNIKTNNVINPGMGFYRTRYITLKRVTDTLDYDFESNGFYHVRIDISDFSKTNNGIDDYDITESALNALDNYFINAEANKCSLIIRFAYDGYKGLADKEPSISKMKDHIKSLGTIINQHKNLIIAVECGLIGPWGEMHTSTLDVQSTYNELLPAWLNNVEDLPILCRRPSFIYKYLNYDLDNLNDFNEEGLRLGVFNDGYYGTNLDQGTYENLEARDKATKFIGKLGNLTGGECIGEPTRFFDYPEIIEEMNLINLTYLNYEWDNSIIISWKDKKYGDTSFYDYMVNHMGFKLYVDNINYILNNNELNVGINLSNMGFSHITRNLKAELYFIIDGNKTSIKTDISDNHLNINLGKVLYNEKNIKVYLKITDKLDRSYELMNGTFENDSNYLGEIIIN